METTRIFVEVAKESSSMQKFICLLHENLFPCFVLLTVPLLLIRCDSHINTVHCLQCNKISNLSYHLRLKKKMVELSVTHTVFKPSNTHNFHVQPLCP
jgi:hypothetical protein